VNRRAISKHEASRITLHTAAYGGSARALLILAMIGGALAAPLLVHAVLGLRSVSEALHLLALLLVAGWLFWFQLRERPRVYAGAAGLDLEWAWGGQRHIAWAEIRSVKANSLLGKHLGRRFHVQLVKGSLDFYARSDLPQVIARFRP
jgi:hypothetical protein